VCHGFKSRADQAAYKPRRLERFGDKAGTDAAGADLDGCDCAVFDGFDLLDVRVPDGTGLVVGMAHVVAEAGAFSADFTFSRHIACPPLIAEKEFLAD
jgi:hypothetical protein